MMTSVLMIILLLAPAPASAPTSKIFGVDANATRAEVLQGFSPIGDVVSARWTSQTLADTEILRFECPARKQCFSHPWRAEFVLLKGRLASASFLINRENGPSADSVNAVVLATLRDLGFQGADALKNQVGRRTRYFLKPDMTVVWVQDGPDAELKMYADRLNPIGRAEAVAAGASAVLDAYPGASEYAIAQGLIAARKHESAAVSLDRILEMKRASPLLKRETKLVLAMVLAAIVTTWLKDERTHEKRLLRARVHLQRAKSLAPDLTPHLNKLEAQLKVRAGP